jgi:hypothetical protein
MRRSLSSNQFSGTIPSTIGQWTSILSLYESRLLGSAVIISLKSQKFAHQPIDRHDSIDDWTIDSAHSLVSVFDDFVLSLSPLLPYTRRYLSNNQLTGTIPPAIGQLKALNRL